MEGERRRDEGKGEGGRGKRKEMGGEGGKGWPAPPPFRKFLDTPLNCFISFQSMHTF